MPQQPPSHVNCRSVVSLGAKLAHYGPPTLPDKLIARAAGVVAAVACNSKELTWAERVNSPDGPSDISFLLQVYLLCYTLGWPVAHVVQMIPIKESDVHDWVRDVNEQRENSTLADAQAMRAELMILDIAAPMMGE